MPLARPLVLILAAATLAACSGGEIQRFAVPAVPADQRVAIRYQSVELREVSLPTYAASEEIFTRGPEGALISSTELLWADDPTRAITLELSRHLMQLTGARVAAEPWPYAGYADVAVEVRVEELVADADGQLRLSGQYFVAPESSRGERSGLFAIAEPIAAPGGPAAVAAARGRAVAQLARRLATEGLR